MNKKKNVFKNILLITIVCTLLLGCVSCSSKKEEYFVTWKDADGTLIEYSTIDFGIQLLCR